MPIHATAFVWKSRGNSGKCFSPSKCGPRDWTQSIHLGCRCFSPLILLNPPPCIILTHLSKKSPLYVTFVCIVYQEISVSFPRYCSALLLLTAGLGQLLKSYLHHTKVQLAHRPFVTLTNLVDVIVFPGKFYISHSPLTMSSWRYLHSS